MHYEFHDFDTDVIKKYNTLDEMPKGVRQWFETIIEIGSEYIRVGSELYSVVQHEQT